MVYLDYAANSPVDKKVLDKFYETNLKYFANPNSNHRLGIEAKELIETSTKNIAKNLKVDSEEVIYTSGATESNNLVVRGIAERYKNNGKHIIISSLEHSSIIAPVSYLTQNGYEVDIVELDENGRVSIDSLKELLRDDTILVSITSVDSELGIVQPIEEIGKILKDYPNTYFHTDASQALGKIKLDFTNVDLITIAPHKFYGLNGFGALIKKKNISLTPIILGGKSTTVYRSGTPVLPMVVSLDLALDLAIKNLDERYEYISKINQEVRNYLSKYDLLHINSTEYSMPYTLNFSVKGVKSDEFVKKLSDNEIYVSTKASCCPDNTPSKSVYALTKDKTLANTSIRISFSHLTTKEELEKFYAIFDTVYKELTSGKI